MKTIKIYTDGASRSNPGEAASGVYITDERGNLINGFGKRLGIATNNVAEYTAVLLAYDWLIENKSKFDNLQQINFYMDSNLVYSQLTGLFKLKNPVMASLCMQVKKKEKDLGIPATYSYIPREKNKEADRYVNLALDNLL